MDPLQVNMKYGVVKSGTISGLVKEVNKVIAANPDEIELQGGISFDGHDYIQAYSLITF